MHFRAAVLTGGLSAIVIGGLTAFNVLQSTNESQEAIDKAKNITKEFQNDLHEIERNKDDKEIDLLHACEKEMLLEVELMKQNQQANELLDQVQNHNEFKEQIVQADRLIKTIQRLFTRVLNTWEQIDTYMKTER